ncbi:LamG-like jellyroll fold domain-containing protein [Kineosporia babensis]|uniref:Fibronectin type III domain-containing protein n=1 Tax=Kineosporia babensis TaxID=499548 RepID=A0A9X1SV48_9ACTN|nr:fibronectin type III domain-containing protein [Kineosporia babensis]
MAGTAQAADCDVPGAPASATATSPGSNQLKTTFGAAADNGTSIQGYIAQAYKGTTAGPAVAVAADATTATLTGVAAGTGWTVRVRAVSTCGNGAVRTSAAVTVAGAATTYASSVLASAPSAYYRLGEAESLEVGADSSATAATLRYGYTGQERSQAGALANDTDKSANANGSELGRSSLTLPDEDNARSVEAWFKPRDNNYRTIAQWGTHNTYRDFHVAAHPNWINVGTWSNEAWFPAPRALDDGVWHHLAVTASGDKVTAYLDGQLLGSRTLDQPIATRVDDNTLRLGDYGYHYPWYGGLDEVAVYSKELTSTEVSSHFAASGWSRPNPASRVSIAAASDNEAVVSWSLPTTASKPPASSYLVTAQNPEGVTQAQTVVAGTKTSARITGLAGDSAYSATVRPVNTYGLGTAATSPSSATVEGAATTYSSTVRADSPVAYYRLGEPNGVSLGGDSSVRNNQLQYRAERKAVADGALVGDSDGAVNTVDSPRGAGWSPARTPAGNSARSLEAWVRPATDGFHYVASWGTRESRREFGVAVEGKDVLLQDSASSVRFKGKKVLTDGSWHHLVLSYNGSKATVYIDGTSLGSVALTALRTLDSSGLWVGSNLNGDYRWYGALDEVAVYDKALSATQVQAHLAASGHQPPVLSGDVSVTPGANRITATWPEPTSGDTPTRYTVTAYKGTTPVNSIIVAGDVTTATIGDLPGGTAYTVAVQASSLYGDSARLTSPASTVTGSATTHSGSVLANSPIAYYRLGEETGVTSAADSSAYSANNAQQLVLTNPGIGGNGVLAAPDRGANANGNPLGNAPVSRLPQGDAPLSVGAWIKPSDSYNYRWVAGWGANGAGNGISFGYGDALLVADIGEGRVQFPTNRSLTDGAWHHVAYTVTGQNITAYLDGVSLGTRTFGTPRDIGGDKRLWVGSAPQNYYPAYGGLDEVAVFSTALTAAQVSAQFTTGGHPRPGQVGTVTASARPNGAAVSWTAPTATPDAVTDYLVKAFRGTTPVNAKVVPAGTTSTTLTGLVGASPYTVQVSAANAYGFGAARASAAVTPTGTTSTYASTVLSNSPSAYYRLGEPSNTNTYLADSSGRGANLRRHSSALGETGAIGEDADTAAACCGVTASGLVASLPKGNGSRTAEAWVKLTDTSERWLVGWGGDSERGFSVGVRPNAVLVRGNGQTQNFSTDVVEKSISDNNWHLITATYDSTTHEVTAYLDGVSLGSEAFTDPELTSTANSKLWLGADSTGNSQHYGGLDEVAIYPTALTAAQVEARVNASGHAVPGVVSLISASARENGAAVTWEAPTTGDTPTRYRVTAFRGSTPLNSVIVAPGTTNTLLTGLPGAVDYTIQVRAANSLGEGPAAVSTVIRPTGAATTYAAEVLTDAPKAYYRLSEATGSAGLADSSGRSITGSQSGTAGSWASFGGAGALRGDDDASASTTWNYEVARSTVRDLPGGDAARTLEGWARPGTTDDSYLIGYGSNSRDRGFSLGYVGESVVVNVGARELKFPAGRSLQNAWHHFATTYDGTSITAYLDGQSLGTKELTEPLYTTTDDDLLWIGSRHENYPGVHGDLDEVAVYSASLSAARIKAHFDNSGRSVPGTVPSVAATGGANRVTVTWATAPGADAATSYTITAVRSGGVVNAKTVAGNIRSTVISGLPGGSAHTVKVTANNEFGSGPSGTGVTATPTGGTSTYVTQVQALNPLAYYRLGDSTGSPSLADSSGKGSQLIPYYGTTLGVAGAVRNDPDTSASGNNSTPIGRSVVPDLPKGTGARSVEYWVKRTDGNHRWDVAWGDSETGRAFAIGVSGSNLTVDSYYNALTFATGKDLVDGAWHHVVVTYNGTSVTAYLDGASLGAQTFSTRLRTANVDNRLFVGSDHEGNTGFSGGIDEVAIFGTVLTAAQVSAHYTSGR